MTTPKLISQGAEAKIFLKEELSQKVDGKEQKVKPYILKSRISKSYRHPAIDEDLRKKRTRREARLLSRALEVGVFVPRVLNVSEYNLEIEHIAGDRLSETLNSYEEKKQFFVMNEIGRQVAILHEKDIIHGDLTTSNTILSGEKVFIIDFGLGFISKKIEDKAVDLHLIKQALEAKHFQNHEKLFEEFLKYYNYSDKTKVLDRLKAVEKRGRYRH